MLFIIKGKHFSRQIVIGLRKGGQESEEDLHGTVVKTGCAWPQEDNG